MSGRICRCRRSGEFGLGPGKCPAGYVSYEDLIAAARDSEPDVTVAPDDPWMLMYTSGTTGNPKGAIRNHRGGAMLSLITEIELGMHRNDGALLVMPMCHANSLYFFGAFAYCGATTTVYSRKNFDPEHCAAFSARASPPSPRWCPPTTP